MNRLTIRIATWVAAGLLASACGKSSGSSTASTSSGSSGSSMGSSSSGSATSSSGSSSSGAAATTYCDGFQASNASNADVDVQYYAFNRTLERQGCDAQLEDGGTYTELGGIWDLDTSDNGAGSPVHALFVSNCADVGLSVAVVVRDGGGGGGGFDAGIATDGGYDYLPYDGGYTVAEALVAQTGLDGGGATLWGEVTAVEPWSVTEMKSGLFYLQDPVLAGGTPGAGTGVSIYFDDPDLAGVGSAIPHPGDIVVLTNLKWSPYNGQNQYAGVPTSTIVTIGTAPLPPPVSLAGSDVSPAGDSTSDPYLGMRVTVTGGPYTASATCPTALEYTSSD